MRVIDSHVHLYPAEINADPAGWAAAAGEPLWCTLSTRRRPTGRPVQDFPDVETLLRRMDAAGVDEAVLLGWYWQTAAACRRQNAFFATVMERHGDRLRGCATWHPEMDVAEVATWRAAGFVGIGELSPHSVGAVGDPRWDALLSAAGAAGLAVNLHVTDPRSRPYVGRVETPLFDFLTWARRHPGTTLVLAHGGGRLPWLLPEILRLPNVVFDLAAFPLLYPPPELDAWIARCGPERLLWGSDHPLDLYPRVQHDDGGWRTWRTALTASGYGDEVRAAVLGGNAARIYPRLV